MLQFSISEVASGREMAALVAIGSGGDRAFGVLSYPIHSLKRLHPALAAALRDLLISFRLALHILSSAASIAWLILSFCRSPLATRLT